MMTSSIRGLILIFFFAQGVENLVFSFRSQYDGYIYPKWKKKGKGKERFYEDAVVVGKNFMVLGDGLGGTEGFSGIYSIHQCLNIAEKLETNTFTTVKEVDVKVKAALKESNKSLGFSHLKNDKRDVGTTLVYMKLEDKKLLTGVIGDSGFSIYRYNKDEGIMKLEHRSKEAVYNFNGPHYVSPDGSNDADKKEYDVLERDIVVVASDGVLDVLPSSFLTAATNYLVGKMIEKKRQQDDLKKINPNYDFENDLNYDYDFDLTYFLEGYVQNVRELTQKFRDYILERKSNLNQPGTRFVPRHSQLKHIVKPLSQNFNIDPTDISATQNSKNKNINSSHQSPQRKKIFETDSSAIKYQIPDDHPTQLGKREIIFKNPKFDSTIRQPQQDQNNQNFSGQFNNQQSISKSSANKSEYEHSPIKNLSSDDSDMDDLEHDEFEEKATEVNKPYQDFNVKKFQNIVELSNDQIKLKNMINDSM